MRSLTINCCGLATVHSNIYCCKLVAILKRLPLEVDYVCLQETHTTAESLTTHFAFHLEQAGWLYFFSHGTASSRGVAVLIHKHTSPNAKMIHSDSEGRVILVSAPTIRLTSTILLQILVPSASPPQKHQVNYLAYTIW